MTKQISIPMPSRGGYVTLPPNTVVTSIAVGHFTSRHDHLVLDIEAPDVEAPGEEHTILRGGLPPAGAVVIGTINGDVFYLADGRLRF